MVAVLGGDDTAEDRREQRIALDLVIERVEPTSDGIGPADPVVDAGRFADETKLTRQTGLMPGSTV